MLAFLIARALPLLGSTAVRFVLGALGAAAIAGGTWFAGDLHGAHRKQAEWNIAKANEIDRENRLILTANADEVKLGKLTATLNETADQLEKAREDAQATVPPPADCADSPADLGELRRLIDGK